MNEERHIEDQLLRDMIISSASVLEVSREEEDSNKKIIDWIHWWQENKLNYL